MALSPQQQQVVDHRGGHLQVIACAGSGKTEPIPVGGQGRNGVQPRSLPTVRPAMLPNDVQWTQSSLSTGPRISAKASGETRKPEDGGSQHDERRD
jgi:hypothetical protein